MSDNEQNRPDNYYVSQTEPEAKPPPALETGIIKWIYENLASSVLNVILTLIGIAIIWLSITGLTTWIVRDANWFSITANFRNFMLGRYEAAYEWRATWTLFISVFIMGAAVAVWIKQIARTMLISIIIIILSLQLLPPIINATNDLPSWYAGAGNVELAVNQTTEVPFDEIAFIGQAEDEIQIQFASDDIADEEALANLNGFVDNVANQLRNLASNRLEDIAQLEQWEALVAEHEEALAEGGVPVLTEAQYLEFTDEIADAEIPPQPIDFYNLNQNPVLVEILDADTLDVVASATLTTPDDILSLTLPEDSWYILRKTFAVSDADATTEDETASDDTEAEGFASNEGIALLDVHGIYPSAKRESNIETAFTRRPDGFIIEGPNVTEPVDKWQCFTIDDRFSDIIRNQYRGEKTLEHYLRMYVSPFFSQIGNYTTLLLLTGIAGYWLAELLWAQAGKQTASRFASYGLMSIPVILWVLINGMYLFSVMMWLIFIAMAIASYVLYKLTQRDGLTPLIAVASGIVVLLGVGVVIDASGFDLPRLLTVLPLLIDDAAVPRFMIWLGVIFVPLAIYLGNDAHIPGEEVKFNLPLWAGLSAVLFVGATFALVTGQVTPETEWALQPSDARNWGGMLLTVMLTVYGIIIAFPLGLALALGRRSDLPLIKYLCTAYIELVRGSPFITVLFFAQLFIPLLNQEFNQIPNSYRAIAATIAFSAAYLAENVRGGLQSLPPGQEEAAKALGLSPWQTIRLITMPQALRAVIPALVGQFISLYKDTTLVAIVGLIDLVGFVGAMVVQAEFIGTRLEGLLFISILYFVFSYVMSYISRLLEASGSGSTRRM